MKKKALLIGINYRGSNCELNGCENDVFSIKKVLVQKLGYNEKDIVVMTENVGPKPTKKNILNEISKLAISAYNEKLDEIWFHYSGHGINIVDKSGDEKDGYDECLCPLDYNTKGLITDDLLHSYFSKLPQKTRCVCIMDCCHSGSILDLRYRYLSDKESVVENKNCKIKGNMISISGCRDDQTSADAYISNDWRGAMTTSLLEVLKASNYSISCGALLFNMRKYLSLSRYKQVPQICSNHKLDHTALFCSKDSKLSFVQI